MTQNTNKFAGAQEVFFKHFENNFDVKSEKKAAYLALEKVVHHYGLEISFTTEEGVLYGHGDSFITGFDNCEELRAFASELGLTPGNAQKKNGEDIYRYFGAEYYIKPINNAERLLDDNDELKDFDAEMEWLDNMSKEERKSFYEDSPLHANLRTLKRPRFNKQKEIRVTNFEQVWIEPIETMRYYHDTITYEIGCQADEVALETLVSAYHNSKEDNN